MKIGTGAPWLALFACSCAPAIDDPANPPERGQWRDETVAIGVTFDNVSLPREALPANIATMLDDATRSTEQCGEPHLRSVEEATRLLQERFPDCAVETLERQGSAVSGLARCAPREVNGLSVVPTVRIEGTVGRRNLLLDVRSMVRMPQPGGSSHMVIVALRRALERIGDC